MYLEDIIERMSPEISNQMAAIAKWALNEEDLRIEVEKQLDPFLKLAGLKDKLKGHHEFTIGSGRADSIYSLVIIEYKKPGRLSSSNVSQGNQEAISQLKERFIALEKQEKRSRTRMFGVGTDGFRFIFVRYRANDWEISEPLDVTEKTVKIFLRRLSSLGLAGKALLPEYLVGDFGAESQIALGCVQTLFEKVRSLRSPKAQKLFEQWQVMFSEVCGYDLENSKPHLRMLAANYGLPEDAVPSHFLFAIHSYFATFMKLLATEMVSFFHKMPSYLGKLVSLSGEALKTELTHLEKEGGIFKQFGINNFLEGDLFAWYLDEWDAKMESALHSIIEGLEQYDPATLSVEPQEARDLLKQLYQYLIDRRVRHDLGEYYTPDWLAGLVLDEIGYIGDTNTRILDPACGSGTFLVMAINRSKMYAEENTIPPKEVAKNIVQNVVGFDLNPLAVMAARTNFVMALGDLLRYVGEVEIPVYLCDSILTPREFTTLYTGSRKVRTSVGEFHIPLAVVTKNKVSLLANVLERCAGAEKEYVSEEFLSLAKKELALTNGEYEASKELLKDLYKRVQSLEKEGINGIWSRIIKNAFAPVFVGKFDFVAGNPPWINWENLPQDYREATSPLWQRYGLAARSTSEQFELGKMRRDLSMLFTYACSDAYLLDGGTLGFLITQMVFKTRSGEVFRKFKLPNDVPLKVLKIHDMVDLKPFEDAANMTSMIILKRGQETKYPVPYIVWTKTREGDLAKATLKQILESTQTHELVANPVEKGNRTSMWLTTEASAVEATKKLRGISPYKAYTGTYTGGANGIFWVSVEQALSSGNVVIRNLYDMGKKKVKQVVLQVESDLIYPLVRSGDILRWQASPRFGIVLPHTKTTGWQAIAEGIMRLKYPRTYSFLVSFKDLLLERRAYALLRQGHPFYIMVDIHSHTFAPYKLAWKRMGSRIEAAVLEPVDFYKPGKKPMIPQETVAFIPLKDRKEAHYLCAILNSNVIEFLIRSFSQTGGKSFATPSILDQIRIPEYDEKDSKHVRLASLSLEAHSRLGSSKDVGLIEKEINEAVCELYGLTKGDLKAIEASLMVAN